MGFLFVVMLKGIFAVSCTQQQTNSDSGLTAKKTAGISPVYPASYKIIEFTHDGATHEFLVGTRCLEHWPSCKYCNPVPQDEPARPVRDEIKSLQVPKNLYNNQTIPPLND